MLRSGTSYTFSYENFWTLDGSYGNGNIVKNLYQNLPNSCGELCDAGHIGAGSTRNGGDGLVILQDVTPLGNFEIVPGPESGVFKMIG